MCEKYDTKCSRIAVCKDKTSKLVKHASGPSKNEESVGSDVWPATAGERRYKLNGVLPTVQ